MSADSFRHSLDGQDHVFVWDALGYAVRVASVHRNGHGLYGELAVTTSHPLSEGGSPGHLFFDLLNLSKNEEKTRAVKALAALTDRGASPIPWERMLEAVRCVVRDEHHGGRPFLKLKDVKAGPIQWLIHRVIPLNQPSVFFAAGATGKSTVAAWVAVALATGRKVGPFSPSQSSCNVLVLDWETAAEPWKRRVAAICRGVGIEEPDGIFYQEQSGPLVDSAAAISRRVVQERIEVVIVDSLMGAFAGAIVPENTTPFFNCLRAMPVTPLIVHHLTKGDARESNGPPDMYGDVTIRNRSRAAWALKREDDGSDEGLMDIVMTNVKFNDAPLQPSIGCRIVHHGWEQEEYSITHEQFDPLGARTISSNLRLSDRIIGELRLTRSTHKALAGDLNVPEVTVRRALYRLKDRGIVESVTDGKGPDAETTWGLSRGRAG